MADDNEIPAGPGLESVFLDNAEMTVDSKLRVGIPERFMKVLKIVCPEHVDKVGLVPGEDGSLKLLPYPDYLKRVAFWQKLNDRIASHRTIKKFETSLSKLLPLDAQNRVKLTPAHASFAGIDKEAMVVGAVECMKIYSRKGFEKMIEREMAEYVKASDLVERESEPKPAPQFVIEARPVAGA